MSLTAFLVSNAMLVVVLLAWNLFTLLSLRTASSEPESRWTASVGLQWRFGAASAALIAVAIATFEAVLFGEPDEVTEVAAMFSLLALAVAVAHAVVSILLFAELMGRGLDPSTSSFSDDSPWRRPVEWATVVLVPLSLIAALVLGVVAWSLA